MAHDLAARAVLYEIPGMQDLQAQPHECVGADGAPLSVAFYLPAAPIQLPPPVVVIVEGYADTGFSKMLGCRFMDMGWSVSTARLIAASGMAAITYANRRPAADAAALLAHIASECAALGVDGGRVGLWATSGHGPVAISVLERVRCAVLLNPYLCDFDGATHVADAARTFRFETPACAPAAVPQFLVRSGRDEMPGLTASFDRYVARALSLNHPITVVNHADAPHAFDLLHDSATTRGILRQALDFLQVHLHSVLMP